MPDPPLSLADEESLSFSSLTAAAAAAAAAALLLLIPFFLLVFLRVATSFIRPAIFLLSCSTLMSLIRSVSLSLLRIAISLSKFLLFNSVIWKTKF